MDKVIYVIIPVYNASKFLKKCIDSILSQTYKNLVIICVNDGSSDNSLDILKEYSSNYNNFIIVDKNNEGCPAARNSGLDNVKSFYGNYISFIDSDDWLKEDYYETLITYIEKYDADMVSSYNYDYYSENDIRNSNKDYIEILDQFETTKNIINSKMSRLLMTKLFKSELWISKRFDESLKYNDDTQSLFDVVPMCKLSVNIGYIGYYLNRIQNEPSYMRQKFSNKKAFDCFSVDKRLYEKKYINFSSEQNSFLKQLAINEIADNFLSIYPRLKIKGASKEEKNIIKQYLRFILVNHIVNLFVPYNHETKIKKMFFLLSKKTYRFLFRVRLFLFSKNYRYGVSQ